MDENKIKELTRKFIAGSASEEEKNLLHHWYDQQYSHSYTEYHVNSGASKEEVRRRVYQQLTNQIKTENLNQKWKLRNWSIYTAAAVLIFLAVFTGISTWNNKSQEELIIATVSMGSVQKILLPDGSIVWLNAGSTLQYPRNFTRQIRSVNLLDGQAFFEITRDVDRPFEVQSSGLVISVLGTSFDVKAYKTESQSVVSVRTGRVNVQSEGDRVNNVVELIAGDQISIQKEDNSITKTVAPADIIGSWTEGRLTFQNEPVGSVINALERKYNIKAEVESDEILRQTVSLKVDEQPLKNILEVLQYTLGFKFEMINERTVKIYK